MSFKVGDKVRRTGTNYGRFGLNREIEGPKTGEIFIVAATSDDWMQLEEFKIDRYDKYPFAMNQFELVRPDSVPTRPSGSSQGVNPKDLLGIKKVQLDLVPPSSLIYQALAMQDGAVKYGPYNWRTKKVKASIYLAAAKRHIDSFLDGEELAYDSKKPHLAHALACIGIIVDAFETGNLADDRPTPGVASKLLAKWEKKDK